MSSASIVVGLTQMGSSTVVTCSPATVTVTPAAGVAITWSVGPASGAGPTAPGNASIVGVNLIGWTGAGPGSVNASVWTLGDTVSVSAMTSFSYSLSIAVGTQTLSFDPEIVNSPPGPC